MGGREGCGGISGEGEERRLSGEGPRRREGAEREEGARGRARARGRGQEAVREGRRGVGDGRRRLDIRRSKMKGCLIRKRVR